MPVIIPKESIGIWLDPVRSDHTFKEFFQPYSPDKMRAYPVSGMVNSPKNEGIGCIKNIEVV